MDGLTQTGASDLGEHATAINFENKNVNKNFNGQNVHCQKFWKNACKQRCPRFCPTECCPWATTKGKGMCPETLPLHQTHPGFVQNDRVNAEASWKRFSANFWRHRRVAKRCGQVGAAWGSAWGAGSLQLQNPCTAWKTLGKKTMNLPIFIP
ncbi:MAG: hypothetical protein ORN29_02915 [Rhodoferax sp.]|nr:hypothetical protein [Rhodoferax sp.]